MTLSVFPRKLTAMPDGTRFSGFAGWCQQHITGDDRSLELLGANPLKDAHAALDAAVLAAYGFSAKADLPAQQLALSQKVAAKIERGEPVIAPGVPPNYPDQQKLVTEDCILPAEGST